MRQQITVALTTALLAGLVTASVTAQDKDLRMGDDPAYFERVEVPEAGVAVSFPQGWEVDVQLEYDETESGDPENGYWNVLFAFGGAEGWCGLTRHPHPVGEVSELAPSRRAICWSPAVVRRRPRRPRSS